MSDDADWSCGSYVVLMKVGQKGIGGQPVHEQGYWWKHRLLLRVDGASVILVSSLVGWWRGGRGDATRSKHTEDEGC